MLTVCDELHLYFLFLGGWNIKGIWHDSFR